jgi:transcriptional regulator GlxA family with amidase domain
MAKNVGIYVFDDVEALDFAGPYEVFTTASRVSKRLRQEQSEPFHVFSVSAKQTVIRARAGLQIVPDFQFEEHPSIDVLIVPGGVVSNELEKSKVLQWVSEQAAHSELVASVCTGVFILAQANVIANESVTTHWEDIEDLAKAFPSLTVVQGKRWIDQGKIITSAGISAGIDMCLHIVSKLENPALAQATARQMDYEWRHKNV